MKPSAFRIERLLAKVEAEVARRGLRARRYAFHPDEVAVRCASMSTGRMSTGRMSTGQSRHSGGRMSRGHSRL